MITIDLDIKISGIKMTDIDVEVDVEVVIFHYPEIKTRVIFHEDYNDHDDGPQNNEPIIEQSKQSKQLEQSKQSKQPRKIIQLENTKVIDFANQHVGLLHQQ
jgi:hypothetical protein